MYFVCCFKYFWCFVCVVNLTVEYVQVDKQLLKDIIKEVGELRKLADSLITKAAVNEEVFRSCLAESASEQIETPQV